MVVGIALQGRPGAAISLIVEPGAACGVARQFLGLEPDDENPDRIEEVLAAGAQAARIAAMKTLDRVRHAVGLT